MYWLLSHPVMLYIILITIFELSSNMLVLDSNDASDASFVSGGGLLSGGIGSGGGDRATNNCC